MFMFQVSLGGVDRVIASSKDLTPEWGVVWCSDRSKAGGKEQAARLLEGNAAYIKVVRYFALLRVNSIGFPIISIVNLSVSPESSPL